MAKILLVEDNELNQDMLTRRLKRRGYEVVWAVDGEESLEIAVRETPGLILMDMGLPGIDGYEATRRIKAEEQTASIPIIGLSAHAMTGDRDKAIRAGCDDYDTKPIEFSRLVTKIEKILGESRPA